MLIQDMQLDETSRIWKPFTINVSLIILLFLVGIFIGFMSRTDRIIQSHLLSTAKSHFDNIVLARRWSANYGGVFVKKTEGVVSNPYLENPDIQSVDGTVYTLKNPALMTREISTYAEKAGTFKYNITSLMPLNPHNKPDEFETAALKKFKTGIPEVFEVATQGDKSVFRYMAPLFVEQGCLGCHAKQGYRIGDVRGGISVNFDITQIKKEMTWNKIFVSILSVITATALLTIIIVMVSRLAKKLSSAYHTIEHMSITDELTQLFNRRHFHVRIEEEISRTKRYKHPLSLLMLDIDHFKQVNDTHGHQAGDAVLSGVAATVRSNIRVVDMAARYGGEEIVVVLPETDQAGAVITAEKIRAAIEQRDFSTPDGKDIRVTASIGISSLEMVRFENGNKAEQLIKQADDALYRAKAQGRNRVVTALTS